MAGLLIRDVEDEVKRELERRAGENGRRLEEEVLEILRVALETEDEEDERDSTS